MNVRYVPQIVSRYLALGASLAVSSWCSAGWAQLDHCVQGNCNCPACQEFLEGCAADSPCTMQPAPVVDAPTSPTPADSPSSSQPAISPEAANSLTAPPAPNDVTPSTSSLASSLDSYGGGAGIPDMIGDLFGGGYNYAFIGPNATVATAGGDRRMKLAENNSPFPRNRVFFNYHHFHNAVTDVQGRDQDLNRYVFGWEKLIYQDLISVELRVPFSGTVGSNPGGQDGLGRTTEFGNMSLVTKGLLYRDANTAIATGLGIVFPTGSDYVIQLDGVAPNFFRNDAVHLQPFVGVYRAPTARTFHQGFLQFDFDTGGNDVLAEGISDKLTDATLMFVDYSFGYWLKRDPRADWMRGIAPMLELHYTTTVQDQNYGAFGVNQSSFGNRGIFVIDPRRDVLNITGGVFFELTQKSTVKIFAVAPLRDGSDKLYDTELGLQFSRRY